MPLAPSTWVKQTHPSMYVIIAAASGIQAALSVRVRKRASEGEEREKHPLWLCKQGARNFEDGGKGGDLLYIDGGGVGSC